MNADHRAPDLSKHLGDWTGTWSTWLRPGELHDESAITLEVLDHDDGWLLSYEGTIAGDPVTGRMLVAPDGRIAWTDSWHTAGEEQTLVPTDDGPAAYGYGPPDAPWTWSIDIDPAPDRLVITHHNAPPGIGPARAVLMDLVRA